MASIQSSPNYRHRNLEPGDGTDNEMLSGGRQSSRELSSAAIESERLAQEERRRADSIQEQIRALLEQQKAADDNSRKYREQAEARQQAAREQSFFEIQLSKQADFRGMIPDEVFTRVAGGLGGKEDRDYIKAVAEQRPGFEDPTDFKLLLWAAIAGNDAGFLTNAAKSVFQRFDRKITDADVTAIQASVACLNANVATSEGSPPSQPLHEQALDSPAPQERSPSPALDETDERTARLSAILTSNRDISQEHEPAEELSPRVVQDDNSNQRKDSTIEQEPVVPEFASGGRRSMDDIDDDGDDRSAQALNNAGADSMSGIFLHDEEAEILSIGTRSSPRATPSKRTREEESATSKRIPEPKTPKRPRTTKDPNPSKSFH